MTLLSRMVLPNVLIMCCLSTHEHYCMPAVYPKDYGAKLSLIQCGSKTIPQQKPSMAGHLLKNLLVRSQTYMDFTNGEQRCGYTKPANPNLRAEPPKVTGLVTTQRARLREYTGLQQRQYQLNKT